MCLRACAFVCERLSICVYMCTFACVCMFVFRMSCVFAGACWCARGAPRCVGRATMPSGEEIECEVQYSLGPSSVAAAQQLVH